MYCLISFFISRTLRMDYSMTIFNHSINFSTHKLKGANASQGEQYEVGETLSFAFAIRPVAVSARNKSPHIYGSRTHDMLHRYEIRIFSYFQSLVGLAPQFAYLHPLPDSQFVAAIICISTIDDVLLGCSILSIYHCFCTPLYFR